MLRAIVLILILFPLTAIGCSCSSEAENLEETFKEYDAIFTGIALSTEKTPGDSSLSFYKTKMHVQKVWKNQTVRRSVFIKTYVESNSCGGPPPTVGNSFLVFAHLTTDGLYSTGGCSTFIDLDKMEEYLGSLNPEEKLELQAMMADMWSALGTPLAVYSK
jgi:hypothetical protein